MHARDVPAQVTLLNGKVLVVENDNQNAVAPGLFAISPSQSVSGRHRGDSFVEAGARAETESLNPYRSPPAR